MENSLDHSMIEQSLKDFDRFIGSESRGKASNNTPWNKQPHTPRMQLNFSEIDEDDENESNATPGIKRKSNTHGNDYVKRHRYSVSGLDVCRVLEDKESELVEARAMITSLKGQLSAAETASKKVQFNYDSELSKLRLEQLRKDEMISELQLKLKHSKQSNEHLLSERNQIKGEKDDIKYSLENKLTSSTVETSCQINLLKQKVTELEEKLSHSELKLSNKTREQDLANVEIESIRKELDEKVKKVQSLHMELLQIDTLKIDLNRANAKNTELQGRLNKLTVEEDLAQKFEESIKKVPELERKCAKLEEMNDMYKACSANTKLLEEQVASATDEIKLLTERSNTSAQLLADLEHCKKQLSQLTSVIVEELSLSAVPQPQELKSLLKNLRSEDERLTENYVAIRESVSSHEQKCQTLQDEVKKLKESKEQSTLLQQRQAQLARRLQRKLVMVSNERDSLKNILTSYESEATMTATTVTGSDRVAKMEVELNLYRNEMKNLERELDEYQHAPKLPGDENRLSKVDREEMIKLQDKVEELSSTVSVLEEEKQVLEYRLEQRAIRGDYDPSKVNVVHMAQNPTSEAVSQYKDDVTKLEAEVKDLKEQLLKIQLGNVSSLESLPPASSEEDKKIIKELEKEKKSLEVKNMRMVEAFKSSSAEIREIVYRLLGYKITPNSGESNCYKLASMYAESADDFFMFKYTDKREIQLLSTEFSNSLEEFIEDYLNSNGGSYPAFLSAVTMDLFNKQTIMMPSGSGGSEKSPPCARESEEELRDDSDDESQREDMVDEGDGVEEAEMNSDSEEEEMRRVREETDRRENEDSGEDKSDSDDEDNERENYSDKEDDEEEEDEEEYYNEEEEEEEREIRPPPGKDDDSDDDLICLD